METDLVNAHRDDKVLTSHGLRYQGQCLWFWFGLTEVGDVHPVQLCTRRNEIVLVEKPHSEEHVAQVGAWRRFQCLSLLDLRLCHEVALEQNLLEPEARSAIEHR